MQAVVRPCLNAGIALVGAGVIAAAPIAPPPMNIELPSVHSAAVSLTASWGPLDPYLELLNKTFGNVGTVANQAFSSGVAPILQQLVVNQLTLVHDLNAALNQALSSANPFGLPAVLQKAVSELAAGQFQNAAQTLSTGLIGVALPIVGPLLTPLNNFVNVVSLLPDIALSVGLAVISPPLALLQSTGAAVQSMFNAIAAGNLGQLVNAVLAAPAVMLDGLLNGYQPTQTGGLLTPGLGSLSLLVNIRDMIAKALNPAAPLVAPTTDAVTDTSTDATMVTLDVVTDTEATDTAAVDTAVVDTEADAAATAEAGVETAPEAVEATPEVVEEVAGVDEVPAVEETEATETEATETEATETEATSKDEESDTNSGATDLSDGNKATPGDSGKDSTGAGNDDTDVTDSTDTATSGATGSDAGNTGSDAGNAGSDSSGSDSDSGTE